MKQIFELSKFNLELSKHEVLAFVKDKPFELKENLLIVSCNPDGLEKRLAYTKNIYKFIFSCDRSQLTGKINSFGWQKLYKKSYCVRIINNASTQFEYSEKQLGSIIWGRLKKPKVDLFKPVTPLFFFVLGNEIICAVLRFQLSELFESRKAHKKPGLAPISLDPRLARAMVNLLGIKKGRILDPFCGVAGIMIEASIAGISSLGSDISPKLVAKARKNLKCYKLANYKLTVADFRAVKGTHWFVVTDLPYGKNSRVLGNLESLYDDFLEKLISWKFKRAVVGAPDYIDMNSLCRNHHLAIISSFSIYLHKSLTKKIYVMEKNN